MLRVLGRPRQFCDGVTRREAMTVGALSVLGGSFTLPNLLASEEQKSRDARAGQAKNVLVLYLHGGAPTQDMFDLKPQAPAEIRGEFKPIATSVSGIQVCEHLPKTARWMHRGAIVRSVTHKAGCHNTLPGFTGSEQPVDVNDPIPKDSFPPAMGAVCEYLKPPRTDLPHYVAVPTYLGWGFALKRPGPWGGFLGKRFDPLCSECTPAIDPKPPAGRRPMWLGTPKLADAVLGAGMTLDRLDTRRALLEQLDDEHRRVERLGADTFDRVRQRAFSLLTTSKLKAAFDVEAEDPKVRDRYGRHLFGQSALIGRKLIEAGVRFVDVYWDGYSAKVPTNLDPYWDTHSNNFVQLKQVNLPNLDQTYDALLGDLEDRGLLDETLVVTMSDFGRTPRVNGSAGRDHWTYCYSVVLAGAGIRGGTVCGASDSQAAFVKDRPVRPADVCATIYHCLGIDPETLIADKAGRPVPIAHGGEPIREVLA
ncbi:MAG TPA: DUF1501 domain-containing protein [Gemmataceae bacterium]|nr:DUF1501 domain-containing protein [Gemmataceae bacterium]